MKEENRNTQRYEFFKATFVFCLKIGPKIFKFQNVDLMKMCDVEPYLVWW